MNKGFTLVEMLTTVLILSLILVLVIPSFSDISISAKKTMSKSKISTIEAISQKYASKNINNYQKCVDTTNSACTLTLNQLLALNLITKDDMVNPISNENFTGYIEIKFVASSLSIKATYKE